MDRKRYELFACRDTLTNLVIEGKLAEEDWLYQGFYRLLNFCLYDISVLSLQEIILNYPRASDDVIHKTREKFRSEMDRSDEAVQDAITGILFAFNRVLIDNGRFLGIVVKLCSSRAIRCLPAWVSNLLIHVGAIATLLDAYRLYRQNDELKETIITGHAHMAV